jgi:hypothetical protein
MKNPITNWSNTACLAFAVLALGNVPALAGDNNPTVLPPNSHPYGKTYNKWSSEWWRWAMELPPGAGHPFDPDPSFKITTGQRGKVWFVGAPFGTTVRNCTIPASKALFIGLVNGEISSLEGFATADSQRAAAKEQADLIAGLTCTIDGVPVPNLTSFRFVSPQFKFFAPTPWIFGPTGGAGTAVADGYFLMLAPLSPGDHNIHFTGGIPAFGLSLDATYNLTVVSGSADDDEDE